VAAFVPAVDEGADRVEELFGLRDLLEEVGELGLAVPVVAGLGDLAGRVPQNGEQRGAAVADVVVGGFLLQVGTTPSQAAGTTGPTRHGSGCSVPRLRTGRPWIVGVQTETQSDQPSVMQVYITTIIGGTD
jgi:hypothetical protein